MGETISRQNKRRGKDDDSLSVELRYVEVTGAEQRLRRALDIVLAAANRSESLEAQADASADVDSSNPT